MERPSSQGYPYGNDPDKIQGYRKFWSREPAERPLLVRGTLSHEELHRYLDALDPSGLYLHLMVDSEEQVGGLKRAAGMRV